MRAQSTQTKHDRNIYYEFTIPTLKRNNKTKYLCLDCKIIGESLSISKVRTILDFNSRLEEENVTTILNTFNL